MIRSTVASNAAFSEAQVTWPSASRLQIAWNFGVRSPPAGGPALVVLGQAGLQDAEQVVHPVVQGERIPLEVQVQVSLARLRQAEEPAEGHRLAVLAAVQGEQLPEDPAGVLRRHLDPGLLADAREGLPADVLEGRCHRQLEAGEAAAGPDAAGLERGALAGGGPGDQAQVVVRAAPGLALRAQRQTSQCSTGSG